MHVRIALSNAPLAWEPGLNHAADRRAHALVCDLCTWARVGSRVLAREIHVSMQCAGGRAPSRVCTYARVQQPTALGRGKSLRDSEREALLR